MPGEIVLLLAAAKTTLLIGSALVVVGLAAHRVSAAIRHAVLLAAMIGALCMAPLGAMLPAFSPITFPGRPASVDSALRPWRDNALLFFLVRIDAESALPVRSTWRAAAERQRATILAIWIAGTAFVMLRIGVDAAAAARACSRAVLRGWCGRRVPLFESAEIPAPVAVGVFRRAIMIPPGAMTAHEFRAVIAHELAHVERRDCLTLLAIRATCAVYWFVPLVWHAARRIALERERACDDRVLASGMDSIAYAQLLIRIAHHQSATLRPHAVPSMAHPAHLEKRIRSILDATAPRGGISRRCAVSLVLATCVIITPLAAFAVHDRLPLVRSDPFLDPQSERVPGTRTFDRASAPDVHAPDRALIAIFHEAAKHESEAASDLVPDRARWALSQARNGELIEPLLAELHDPDWRVQGYAAWALAVSRDPRAVMPLIALLEHPVWRLRAMAAFALGEIGDPRAAPVFAHALDDPAWQVRVQAVRYLGALGDPRSKAQIEPLRRDPHIAVRLAADEALSSMK